MTYSRRRRETSAHLPAIKLDQAQLTTERCCCTPLSSLHHISVQATEHHLADQEQFVLLPPSLQHTLRLRLKDVLTRTEMVSIIVLHVVQLERVSSTPNTTLPEQIYHHLSAPVLQQVLTNVRRVIRCDDQLTLHETAGMVLILPDVDRHAAVAILERMYQSICLLQAETFIPPLTHETRIILGCGSFPTPAPTIERLLFYSGQIARNLTLRPALITGQRWDAATVACQPEQTPAPSARNVTGIPYLNLPRELPARLKQVIPYHLAAELRCAPVGRAHHRLTVAMADPQNHETVHRLHQATGLAIFPVACEAEDLNILLEKRW